MKSVKYSNLLSETWMLIWKQPIAFFPAIYSFVVAFILYPLIVLFTGLSILGPNLAVSEENYYHVISFFSIAGILFCFLLVHTSSVQIAIMSFLGRNKSITLKKGFQLSTKLYWRVFAASVLKIIFFLVPAGIVGSYFFYLSSTAVGTVTQTLLILFVGGGVAFILSSWFLFIPPMLPTEKGVWNLFRKGWNLLVKDAPYVLSVTLILAAILTLAVTPGLIFNKFQGDLTYQTIQLIISIVVTVWTTLFIYKAYYKRYT